MHNRKTNNFYLQLINKIMFVRSAYAFRSVDLLTHTPEYNSTIPYRDIFKYEMRNLYLYRARMCTRWLKNYVYARAYVYTE